MPPLDDTGTSTEKCKVAVTKWSMNKKPEKRTITTENNNKKEMKNEENYNKPEKRMQLSMKTL